MEEIRELAIALAAENALKYGKAEVNAVIGKILHMKPELKPRVRELIPLVEEIVRSVNEMPRESLEGLATGVRRERREEARKWPPLAGAEEGKVITRVAPEPNGYPTLGHAKGLLVPFIYARLYRGKFLLRFEDTNPRVERLEYYEAIRSEFAKLLEACEEELGLSPGKWDEEIIESYHLPKMYELAKRMVEQGDAYVCTCPAHEVRRRRKLGIECEHRSQAIEDNLELWERMLNGAFREGEAHLRMKTDMKHPNVTMRDPGIFRIIEEDHPIHGDRFRVYPVYDFSVSVMDSLTGVTHAFRSKEFEPHVEVQRQIVKKLGLREYEMIQFGRITVEGIPLSKRYIRPLVESGILEGWDDPRIPTLRGLFRRGMLPRAIVRFFYELGPSKVDATINMGAIAAINRKIVDPIAKRYMFVTDPVRARIEGLIVPIRASVEVHPNSRETREVRLDEPEVFISSSDSMNLKPGDELRLRGLATVTVRSVNPDEVSLRISSEQKVKGVSIVQWAPVKGGVPARLLVPETPYSFRMLGGYGEPALREIGEGEIVQFVRVGFAKLDRRSPLTFILSHE
ncbi:MAG: glutamate--tRNA ligase [Candidatus Korarchaeum sp.]